jgi:hypothetical protein
MSGAGIQGAGTTSGGFGTSAPATAPDGAILRDTQTGRSFGARLIDPRTRGYVLDEYGRILGMNDVRQAVQLSILTEQGSSVVTSMGQRLRSIQRVTPNFEKQVLAILTEAVQPLVTQGLIEVVGFQGFTAGDGSNGLPRGAAYGRFLWRDLTSKQEYTELV